MLTAQEKIFSVHSSDQKSILKVDEEFKTVLIKISNTIKLANDLNRPFLKRKKIQTSNNYMKKGSIAIK